MLQPISSDTADAGQDPSILASFRSLRGHAPHRPLFTFVDEKGRDQQSRTAGQLAEAAEAVARSLRGWGLAPGDRVAYPLPTAVIMEFIGVPQEGRAPIIGWAKDIMALLGASISGADPVETANTGDRAMREFCAYVNELVEERRREPREDLLSALINASFDGGRLSTEELIVNVMALLNAGLETTSNFLGNGTLALLRNPDQLDVLRRDPSIGESAADELLRFDAPTPFATPQIVTDAIEVGGQVLEPGSIVYLVMGAANRDPAKFPQPDRLDLRRQSAKNLAFGGGIHYCLGAALARTEGRSCLPSLRPVSRTCASIRTHPSRPSAPTPCSAG